MKIKKLITIVLMIIVFLNVAVTISNAAGIDIDSDQLKNIYSGGEDATYNSMAGRIIGVASYICYGAAVIVLIYKGVQFMAKAPEAKAEAKKELVSYVIGAFILFAIGGIIRIIGNIALNNLF